MARVARRRRRSVSGPGRVPASREQYDGSRATGPACTCLPATSCRCADPTPLSYLQGQCSQDVERLEDGESAEALLLNPQGKIEAYLRVTRQGRRRVSSSTPTRGSARRSSARLERFRLRGRRSPSNRSSGRASAVRGRAAEKVVVEAAGVGPVR